MARLSDPIKIRRMPIVTRPVFMAVDLILEILPQLEQDELGQVWDKATALLKSEEEAND